MEFRNKLDICVFIMVLVTVFIIMLWSVSARAVAIEDQWCKYKVCDHQLLFPDTPRPNCLKEIKRQMSPEEMAEVFFFWIQKSRDVFYVCGPKESDLNKPYKKNERIPK